MAGCVQGAIVELVYMYVLRSMSVSNICFFFQAEDGIRDVERSRGLGDVYKRQVIRLTN